MKRIAAAIVALALLAGCQERFRYACQDQKNWDKAECQRPGCAISGTCPDQLNKPEDMKGEK
jgi:hypothetical protein